MTVGALNYKKLNALETASGDIFYKSQNYHSTIKLEDTVFVAMLDGLIVGAVRIREEYGTRVLRGLLVAPHARGRSIAVKLCRQAIEHIGQQDCHCFPIRRTTKAVTGLGFYQIRVEQLPELLRKKYEQYRREGLDVSAMYKSGQS